MKKILAITVFLLCGCTTTEKNNYKEVLKMDKQGRVYQITRDIDQHAAQETARINAINECWQSYNDRSNDPQAIMASALASIATGKQPCDFGTSINDVQIAKEKYKTERHANNRSFIKTLGLAAIGGYAATRVVDTIAAAGAITTFNGDNNQITSGDQSPISQDNAAGVPLNPANVSVGTSVNGVPVQCDVATNMIVGLNESCSCDSYVNNGNACP